MEGLQANLCQILRQRKEEYDMNNQSFDEDNHTVARVLNGGGRFETTCSIMEQMGLSEITYEDGIIIIK